MVREYLKNRLPELTSKIGVAVSIIPVLFDLPTAWNVAFVFVGVVFFGVPQDQAIATFKGKK